MDFSVKSELLFFKYLIWVDLERFHPSPRNVSGSGFATDDENRVIFNNNTGICNRHNRRIRLWNLFHFLLVPKPFDGLNASLGIFGSVDSVVKVSNGDFGSFLSESKDKTLLFPFIQIGTEDDSTFEI